MRPPKFLLVVLAFIIVLSGYSAVPVRAYQQDGRFFAETGHWVRDEFLSFYESAPDPLLLFGYPITEAMPHPMRQGVEIQYFQRARMELDPSQPPNQQVNIAPLGEWLYDITQRGDATNFATNTGACRYFPANGKNVCYAFLQFYDNHNGKTYFGEPISEVEVLEGRLVQYFEYARMEWRPEMPAGQRVALTDVGRLDFDRTIGNIRLMGASDNLPVVSLTSIQVRAFAARPLIAAGQQQTIFAVVQDPYR